MPVIEDDVLIDAPIEAVYRYLSEPENSLTILPNLTDVRNVRPLESGGYEGEFTFRLLEIELTGRFQDIELEPPERRVYTITGDAEAEVVNELASVDGGTRFRMSIDYEPFHDGLLGRITRPMADRFFRREIPSGMDNIRTILESSQ